MDIVREVILDVTTMGLGDSRLFGTFRLTQNHRSNRTRHCSGNRAMPKIDEEKAVDETAEGAAPAAEGEKKPEEAAAEGAKDAASEKPENKPDKGDKPDKAAKTDKGRK